jgi:hypothetical protein
MRGLLEEFAELGEELGELQSRFNELLSAVLRLDEDLFAEGLLQRLCDSAPPRLTPRSSLPDLPRRLRKRQARATSLARLPQPASP